MGFNTPLTGIPGAVGLPGLDGPLGLVGAAAYLPFPTPCTGNFLVPDGRVFSVLNGIVVSALSSSGSPDTFWSSKTDNTFWSSIGATWVPPYWSSGGSQIMDMTPIGGWAVGFRPKKIKVLVYNVNQIYVDVYSSSTVIFKSSGIGPSAMELDLSTMTTDIFKLRVTIVPNGTGESTQINSIQFLI
jgi:hypothetical protein